MALYNFDEIIDRSGTDCEKYDSREKVFGKADVIPLWVADTDFRTPAFITDAIKKRADHEIYGYPIRPESYCNSIQKWLLRQHEWLIDREMLCCSPNVVVGLASLVLSLTQPGDGIIVQPPVYYPFFHVVQGNDRSLIENPLKLKNGRYYFDLEDLKSKINDKTRMLLLCNPHNPGGMSWKRDELEALGKICIKNNIIVVSDEIHADLVLPGHKHLPFASVSEEHARICITAMAASKTFNVAGLSSAFLIFTNRDLYRPYKKFINATHISSGNFFGMIATVAAFTHGDEWLEQLRAYLDCNVKLAEHFISTRMPRIKIMHPEATFLLWLDFRDFGLNDEQLLKKLVDCGVGLSPGYLFGTGGSGFMRLNFGCPRPVLQNALEKMEEGFGKL
jgi:cysteine-S-conjugate beta-lyase